MGFVNYVAKISSVFHNQNIDFNLCDNSKECQKIVKCVSIDNFVNNWYKDVAESNSRKNSSLRLYKTFKNEFAMEPYLLNVINDNHRFALSKFRCSSHQLEIQRARHQNVIPPIWDRVCPHCPYAVDDELHLLLFCNINANLRS